MSVSRVPFRLRPPDLPPELLHRPRLLDALRQRFEQRLVVLRAGAGFGKTTALAHALAENVLDSLGTDAWLQLSEHDRQTDHLIAGLVDALTAAGCGPSEPILDPCLADVVDLVWARAPEPIALVLDDAHVLDGSPAAAFLVDLCRDLPGNGHLVIGSRTAPMVPLRLLQARGQALELTEDDLAFTTPEQTDFARVHHVELAAGASVPAWPALAVLMTTVGHTASIEFLWESVLGSLATERRTALALLVRFGRVDAGLVHAVLGEGWSAEALMTGLPLVESRDGAYRFHDLWRAALSAVVPENEWRAALVAGGEYLIERGEIVRGARSLRAAGADERVVAVARRWGTAPITAGLSGATAEVLMECLPLAERTGALGRYLHTIQSSGFQSERVLHDLGDVYRMAIDHDPELASLALWRQTQLLGDVHPEALAGSEVVELLENVDRLADDGWPLARCCRGLVESYAAEQAHDVAGAIAALRWFEGADPEIERSGVRSRYLSLGHPEQVAISLEEILGEGVSEPVGAHAVWLRGEIDPTLAWPIVRDLPAAYSRRRFAAVQIPLLGVLTTVALAAGDLAGARRLADDALESAPRVLPRPATFAHTADALVVLATEGEAAAATRFASILADVPLAPWPAWGCLGALCAIRVLAPGTEWLDDIDFGHSLRTGLAAARAVLALRAGDPAPARALPWTASTLLRVQVPPSMLTELAVAARDHVPAAAECLAGIPDAARWIDGMVDHHHEGTRAAARALVAGTPTRPAYQLEVLTLGEFTIRRSDGVGVTERVRGGRVQQLVACLLLEDAPLRSAIAARMWPDLGEKQAAANLRVTLASLLDAIEPGRRPGTSWFIRTDEGRLRLGDDRVRVDSREFALHAAAAREDERGARLMSALERHRSAMASYRGEFLPGAKDPEVEHERLRLQALAYHSGCRLAELLLARGEPEDALAAALTAARIDELAERARRVEIRCHLALGSATGARAAARALRGHLTREGITPERDTVLLLDRADPPRT